MCFLKPHTYLIHYFEISNFVFSFEILKEKNIVTKQMKNEYFQENKEKKIEYTREMILFDDQNEIIES